MIEARLHEIRVHLAAIAEQHGPDELAVLEAVAKGLARGRGVYGELRIDVDHRDFRAKAAEELRDALAYFGAQLVRLRRSR